MIDFKLTPEKLNNEIEALVAKGLDYIDAIVHYAEMNDIEIETVAAMVKSNAKMKAKVRQEGEALHFLPPTARLPVE